MEKSLKNNIEKIKNDLGNSPDLNIREFKIGGLIKHDLAIVCIDGLVSADAINNSILKPIMNSGKFKKIKIPSNLLKTIKELIINNAETNIVETIDDLYNHILSGDTVLLINGYDKGLALNTKGWEKRGLEEPQTEISISGQRLGFIENLRTNTSLIRRKINNKDLRFEAMEIGKLTKTKIEIAYLKGLAKEKNINEVKRRLQKIDTDAILGAGYISKYIRDPGYSPFPTVQVTERLEVAASAILEGKIVILVDSSPFALIIPTFFMNFFQAIDDYFLPFDTAIYFRLIRYFALFLTLFLPAIYVAIISFHPDMIPTQYLISVAAQRHSVPFAPILEISIMGGTFEIILESSTRMPRQVGPTISIVGALVLGEAAVQAGLVSPIMIIIVAVASITTLSYPSFLLSSTIRLLRWIFLITAAIFGLYGVGLATIMLFLHLTNVTSLNLPYTFPNAPFNLSQQTDNILRFPLQKMKNRSKLLARR